jgi:ceramide glucosyltransferase
MGLVNILVDLVFLASFAGSAYMLAAAREVRCFARRPRRHPATRPPVTVLKPLCGDEPGLEKNLRSFCDQDYPDLQVVFGIREAADTAVPVAERLVRDRPGRDLVLVVDGRVHGSNLKVSNLLNMMGSARHDLLVIADSDIRVGRGYLDALVGPLVDHDVGVVTCLYVGRAVQGVWSRLGAMFVNYAFLPSVLVAERLGARIGCFGATVALRRETLEAIGGLEVVRDRLADDYDIGAAARALGRRVELSPCVVDTLVFEPDARALLRHELRWLRTTRSVEPWGYAGLVLTHPVVLAALALVLTGASKAAGAVLAIAFLSRMALVYAAHTAFDLGRTDLWLVPARDLLSFGLFVASFFGRSVVWREQRLRAQPGGGLAVEEDGRA